MERSKDRDFPSGSSETVQKTLPLVSCFWCERLHTGEHPLSVCTACSAVHSIMRSSRKLGGLPAALRSVASN